MRFSNEVVIDLPRGKVIALFENPHNYKHWQPGFQEFLPVEGKPGDIGAKSRLTYMNKNQRIELIETIIRKDFPYVFEASYETKGVYNLIQNEFTEKHGSTHWMSFNEFRFSGIMKLFAWAMSGSFKRQSLKYMNNFKDFAEKGVSLVGQVD